MSTVNDIVTANGNFKTVYADRQRDLTPDNSYYSAEAQTMTPDKSPGGDYNLPVVLSCEQGDTKAASSDAAFALNPAEAMEIKYASINGNQYVKRIAFSYNAITRSKNKNAFVSITKAGVKNGLKAAFNDLEYEIMWGKRGLGTISATGTNTFTVTLAEFAAGLWRDARGMSVGIETSGGVLKGYCKVVSVNLTTRVVTVDSLPAGTTSTDVVFKKADGLSGANSMLGIYSMITTSGTVFGISNSTYSIWKSAGTFSAGSAPLTFNKIALALAQAEDNGLGDEIRVIDCVVNTKTFASLGNNLNELRDIDTNYKTDENVLGQEAISFYAGCGKVRLFSHKYMKEGYAFIHPKAARSVQIIGSVPKPTFGIPGAKEGEEYLRTMENNAGCETRLYRDSAMFTEIPNQFLLINNIVNPTV